MSELALRPGAVGAVGRLRARWWLVGWWAASVLLALGAVGFGYRIAVREIEKLDRQRADVRRGLAGEALVGQTLAERCMAGV